MRLGSGTVRVDTDINVLSYASAAGPFEAQGPLKDRFDYVYSDPYMGQKTWEQGESELQKKAYETAVAKNGGASPEIIFAGDLQNQCVASSFCHSAGGVPYIGIYGACSTMAETLVCSCAFLEAGAAAVSAAVTSSHFCAAEKQFRFPLEYGAYRTPTSQHTVTGAGAVILGKAPSDIAVTHYLAGRIVDAGITDANNMGAAMAPSAIDTITRFLADTGIKPSDIGMLVTGDLGCLGKDIFLDKTSEQGMDFSANYDDCGCLIYDMSQDTHSGGSGCGCSASVLCSLLLPKLAAGKINDLLFMATGALMSPTSSQQNESIPGICHLIRFQRIS